MLKTLSHVAGRDRRQRSRSLLADPDRQPTEPLAHPWQPSMAVVAREQLVTSVAGQCDGHALSGKPVGDVIGHVGWIGLRLVGQPSERRDQLDDVVRRHVELGVIRADVSGDLPRGRRLIEARIGEADREASDRPRDSRAAEARVPSRNRSRPIAGPPAERR